jgi:1-acyl-sn-glycerol-3-phosphate acyltransferase
MERCAAIAKKEVNYIGPFGFVAGLCGTIFIRRNKAHDSHTTMSEAAEQVKQKKVGVTVFCGFNSLFCIILLYFPNCCASCS